METPRGKNQRQLRFFKIAKSTFKKQTLNTAALGKYEKSPDK
jgi:hypothetical protein